MCTFVAKQSSFVLNLSCRCLIPQFTVVSPILKIDLISLLFCWEHYVRVCFGNAKN